MKHTFYIIATIITISYTSVSAQSFTISTIAGTGVQGYSGDGGPASNAQLDGCISVTMDKKGDLYFTDGNHIRKIDTSGIITTIAGNDTAGYRGDGSPAIYAEFNIPRDIAIDDSGNIYIADERNQRIRKINSKGIISTYAGNGYIDTTISGGFGGYSGDGGPATKAELNLPNGVCVDDSGNIYIADTYNERIRKVNVKGIITTIAGNGYSYMAYGSYSGDGGPATAAGLNTPTAVTVDKFGEVYISDSYNNCIRKVDSKGIITTFAGNLSNGAGGDGGPATAASLADPNGVVFDNSSNVFINGGDNEIRMVNKNGIISTVAGDGNPGYSGDGGPATAAELNIPYGISIDGLGNIYIPDWQNYRIRKLTLVTGINELTNNTLASLYPNPSNGHFVVQFKNNKHTYNFDIYDLFGNKITTVTIKAGITHVPVDIGNQPTGIYLYRITDMKGNVVKADKVTIIH